MLLNEIDGQTFRRETRPSPARWSGRSSGRRAACRSWLGDRAALQVEQPGPGQLGGLPSRAADPQPVAAHLAAGALAHQDAAHLWLASSTRYVPRSPDDGPADANHPDPSRRLTPQDDGVVGDHVDVVGSRTSGDSRPRRWPDDSTGSFKSLHLPSTAQCCAAIETAEFSGPGRAGLRAGLPAPLYLAPPAADGMPWSEYRPTSSLAGGGVYRPRSSGAMRSWSEPSDVPGGLRADRCPPCRPDGPERGPRGNGRQLTHRVRLRFFDARVRRDGRRLDHRVGYRGDPEAWPRPRWTLVRLNDSGHRSGR